MQRLKLIAGSLSLFALPMLVSAAGLATGADGGPFGDLLENILAFAENVLIPFILGIGFLAFVWGMFQFFIVGGANDDAKEKGKSLMIYATLGFLLIVVFWGVVNLLSASTGLEGEKLDDRPKLTI